MSSIPIQPYKMVFGWEKDNGLGEMLIQQIIRGEKTATCAPKSEYSAEELRQTYAPVGQLMTVYDKQDRPRCNVKLIEVFETTFGNPDLRLVHGEGNGDNAVQFQADHRLAWQDLIEAGMELNDDTILVVELFELVQD
ncbi:ASCH domain-containing protein [Paenibacillus sp. P96]|uniref:ASCH domain-containing protein n=1 Tax=Paenibacillus zeirhizosphaerae TaxID=2987519 RepID=A0ABT9FLI8_9BACL|nr:ASCH domain-containing protein [Paenibacillus sp. P96]MDP4095580.1 ASCH domain-containing protein [Paenibacillus sp. P96]